MTSLIASILSLFGASMIQSETHSIVTRHDNVWIASQPDESDLDAWAASGAKIVINSRTPQETTSLSFDLRQAVESRGMRYVEMPIGGTSGADFQHTRALTALLAETDGPVVMHCRSGTRSSHLYAAHLMSADPAMSTPFDAMSWPGGRDMNLVQNLTPPPSD
jgi:uncharacterized protein (TIGR01244 family)